MFKILKKYWRGNFLARLLKMARQMYLQMELMNRIGESYDDVIVPFCIDYICKSQHQNVRMLLNQKYKNNGVKVP